jgi:hypothetical protein
MASFRTQPLELLGFDPFRGDDDAEAIGQTDQRPHDCCCVRTLGIERHVRSQRQLTMP